MNRSRRLSYPALAAALGASLLLGACNPVSDNLGNRALPEDVAQIKVGQTTKNEVQRLLGSPSNTAPLDDNTWYYVSARQVQWAFMKPRTTEQQVIRMRFDEGGVLQEMRTMDLDDSQNVALVTRTTPTRGGEPGVLRSLYDTLLRGPIGKSDDKKPRGPEY
jgi:outer membrane protein assembly factor BamE (lipoprotein component of BamABCDE complex)